MKFAAKKHPELVEVLTTSASETNLYEKDHTLHTLHYGHVCAMLNLKGLKDPNADEVWSSIGP